jgi:hypothetical protein
VLALAAGSGSLTAAQSPWQHVVTGGFDSKGNTYLFNAVEYKGHLYVGTQALPSTKLWSGVSKSGGDVWRTRDGIAWARVGKPGFGNPNNVRIKQLVVFKNRLYALTGNDAEGIEVWVSSGGPFTRIVRGGFGDRGNRDPIAWVYAGKLVVGTANQRGPQIWVTSDGDRFVRAAAPGLRSTGNTGLIAFQGEHAEGVVLGGHLYVGTSNPTRGGELWRSTDGLRWERVGRGGLGRRADIALDPQAVYGGRLYVVSAHRLDVSTYGGVDVFRSSDGKRFERVVANGFGSKPNENVVGLMATYKNRLYMALHNQDPRLLTPGRPRERFTPKGFELWRTADGKKWVQVEAAGFGNRGNHAAYVYPLRDRLGLFAINYRTGDSLWISQNGVTWTRIWSEGQSTPYGEGGGFYDFGDRVFISTNDLARGIDIWRSRDTDLTP